MYSPQLLDHFEHPRNAGVVENADASVQVENPVCGDVLKLTARVVAGKIAEIKFQAQGCVPAIACGSALTELVLGNTLTHVAALSGHEIVAYLNGLPQASTHASQLAVDALRNLVQNYWRRAPSGQ